MKMIIENQNQNKGGDMKNENITKNQKAEKEVNMEKEIPNSIKEMKYSLAQVQPCSIEGEMVFKARLYGKDIELNERLEIEDTGNEHEYLVRYFAKDIEIEKDDKENYYIYQFVYNTHIRKNGKFCEIKPDDGRDTEFELIMRVDA